MAGLSAGVRHAEVVATLAVAQDHCFGQPPGSQQRACLLAVRLADALGLSADERGVVHRTALLRFVGCTGHAHEVAALFGDDVAARARSFTWDPADPRELARELLLHAGSPAHGLRRARAVVATLRQGRAPADENFRTGCEVADELAARLGVAAEVRHALAFSFERWNGSGYPTRARGEAIPLAARLTLVAQEFEVLARILGTREALGVLDRRGARSYDPAIAAAVRDHGPALLRDLEDVDPWDAALAEDPEPTRMLGGDALDEALTVVADFVDLKSPYLLGHSRAVAALARAAAAAAGLPAADGVAVSRAGLLHDLGRCAVSNAVWDKPGPLTRQDRDEVEGHALRSEQLVRRIGGLAACVPIVAHHHERADGSGYHRGAPSRLLPLTSRLLAAADAYQAMTQPRAHRPALTREQASAELRAGGRRGLFDAEAVEAVLVAAGHERSRRGAGPGAPAGLTPREVEVLVRLARGATTRGIAADLGVAPKTADAHVQHIYTKIGVTTRGAAALFAVRHGLLPTLDG